MPGLCVLALFRGGALGADMSTTLGDSLATCLPITFCNSFGACLRTTLGGFQVHSDNEESSKSSFISLMVIGSSLVPTTLFLPFLDLFFLGFLLIVLVLLASLASLASITGLASACSRVMALRLGNRWA